MSESDNDNSIHIFRFQANDTVITARGPRSTVSSMVMNSNLLNSVNLPMNVNRSYAQSLCNKPRNHYGQRETSPMSTMSGMPMRWRNFNPYPLHPRPMTSRSMYNGRGVSPSASLRSFGSSASVNTTNVLLAIENDQLSKSEYKMIVNAWKKRQKYKSRAKRQKLRDRRIAQKFRYKSGFDSRDSESSLSSDSESIATSVVSNRQFRSGMTNMQDEYMYRPNVTESYSQNFLRGQGDGPEFLHSTQTSYPGNIPNDFNSIHHRLNFSSMSQRDRFRSSSSILPSQRFNREVASSVISEHGETAFNNRSNMINRNEIDACGDTDRDNNEMLPETLGRARKNTTKRKKNIGSDDEVLPTEKRSKISSPCKNMTTARCAPTDHNTSHDFIFAKPSNPVRKPCNKKVASKHPTLKAKATHAPVISPIKPPPENQTLEKDKDPIETNAPSTSDVSLRPSFIKRKLFTQKLDITEEKNLSLEVSNSPQQSLYSLIMKDKQKTRKIQQSASRPCLSRDLAQDDSNLQDLIHKIVPPSEMIVTNHTNTDNRNSKGDDGESDTFTDEEIFNMTIKNNVTQQPPKNKSDCKVVVERMPESTQLGSKLNVKINNVTDKTAMCLKRFWDTDYDSDEEGFLPKTRYADNTKQDDNTVCNKGFSAIQNISTKTSSNMTSALPTSNISSMSQNTTFTNIQKFSTTTLRLKSHRMYTEKKLDKTKDSNRTKNALCLSKIAKENAPPVANCSTLVEEINQHDNLKHAKTTQVRKGKSKTDDAATKPVKEKPTKVNKKQVKTPEVKIKETNKKSTKSVTPKAKKPVVSKHKTVEPSPNTNNKKQSAAKLLKQIQNIETNNNEVAVVKANKKTEVKQNQTDTAKPIKTTKKYTTKENKPYGNNSPVKKSNLNISSSSLRSSRNHLINDTNNGLNSTDEYSIRSLRSRQIDTSFEGTNLKTIGKDKRPRNLLARWTRSCSRSHSNLDSSDVSFSLHNVHSPNTRDKGNKAKTIQNTLISRRLQYDLFLSTNTRSSRKRLPNKKYFG